MRTAWTKPKLLGITVLPEFVQVEGIDGVLDRLCHVAGANAVTTSPYVMQPADAATGSREPPDDAGAGNVRLLDRPLWGRRELYVRTAPSFVPDLALYRGLRYQPAEPTPLTREAGPLVARFLEAARARHLKTYLQVQAAIPPGYRVQFGGPADDDQPRRPDGSVPKNRVAKNGSLASPHLRAYTEALLRDLCRSYPGLDGVRVDWPEYPPYSLDDVFVDFSPPARAAAERLGYDFTAIREAAADLERTLRGGLTNAAIDAWLDDGPSGHVLARALARRPALAEWLAFKARLVEELLAGFRAALDAEVGPQFELVPNAFAPPLTLASGFDFGRALRHATAASTKLYTMHWPMIGRFYLDALRAANPDVDPERLARLVRRALELEGPGGPERFDDWRYPEPDEPHPAPLAAQARKLRQAEAEAGGRPVYALVHGYGPADDFRRRLEVAWTTTSFGVWINRYGYLSDEKLAVVGEVTGRD